MATNAQLYNAVIGSVVGGAFNSAPSSATAADYAAICNAAQAFATQVDSKIALDAALVTPVDAVTLRKVNLMQAICQGVMNGRFPLSTTAADYDKLAAAVAALYTQAITEFV